jgi:hypothetical protein
MTWSALIPGIREIRGPLLAGYLWMLAIWLSYGDRLPNSDSNAVFGRLWEAGEAIGPVGRAAAASVVAYLLGELMNAAIRNTIRLIRARGRLRRLTLGEQAQRDLGRPHRQWGAAGQRTAAQESRGG